MARILGLGGIFIKCPDVESYRNWWKTHMDVDVSEWGSAEWPSDGQAYTVMGMFKNDTDYFAPSDSPFMINLRTDDVALMLKKAIAGGAKAVGNVEEHDYGVFGWFIDPAGIKIELWQAADS